jgi:positive regulator of sigma E activity
MFHLEMANETLVAFSKQRQKEIGACKKSRACGSEKKGQTRGKAGNESHYVPLAPKSSL